VRWHEASPSCSNPTYFGSTCTVTNWCPVHRESRTKSAMVEVPVNCKTWRLNNRCEGCSVSHSVFR
jgi:hypothetical protein